MEHIDRLERLERKINFLTEVVMNYFDNAADPDFLTSKEEEMIRRAKEDSKNGINMYTLEDIENARKKSDFEI